MTRIICSIHPQKDILDSPHKHGSKNGGRGSRKGYVWVIAAVHLGLVYFFYDDGSRSEEVILRELKGYRGTIQSDGLGA